MEITYGEKTVGTGGTYSWKGNSKVGEGTITITESNPNKSVASDLSFSGSEPAKALYTLESSGDAQQLTMAIDMNFGMNPLMRWVGFLFMEGEMNKAFDYGLNNVKQRAEAKPKFKSDISETTTEVINYIGIPTGTLNTEDEKTMMAVMEKSYGQLAADVAKAKIQLAGPAFCLVTKWDEAAKQTEMICAFPVAADAKVPAKYKIQQVPAGKVVKAIHKGDYSGLVNAHMEINEYMQSKNLTMAGNPWESYVTDPMTEKDTAMWVTEIYYPIQ
jgi:effector-binding domain-containing protein